MACRLSFFGDLSRQNKGPGRDPEAFGGAVPYPASSISDVRAETGLWAGKSGIWVRFDTEGGVKNPVFCCAGGCAQASAGRSGGLEQK